MGAEQYFCFVVLQKAGEGVGFAPAGFVAGDAEVVLAIHTPVGEEAVFFELRGTERTGNTALRYRNNGFTNALIRHLVERDEHERARFTRSGRRFEQ